MHIELKNDMVITGQLLSVDQYLNMKLTDIEVEDVERYPHMVLDILLCWLTRFIVVSKKLLY